MRRLFGAAFALLAATPSLAQISPLPTPPSRNDPANFAARADAFLGALPGFAVQANALAAQTQAAAGSAVNAPGTSGTSTTSMVVGTGTKSFGIQAGKAYVAGQFVQIAASSAPTNYMNGQVLSYDPSTGGMNVSVSYAAGTGQFAAWNVALSSPVDPSRFVTKGQGLGQLGNAVSIGWSGTRLKAQVDTVDQGNIVFDAQLAAYQPALGYTPVHQGGGTGQYPNAVYIGYAANGRLRAQVDSTDFGNIAFDTQLAGYQPLLGYTPANKAGDTFTSNINVGASSAGYVALNVGDATHTGTIAFLQAGANQLGYIGYSLNGGAIVYSNNSNTGHNFVGGRVVMNNGLLSGAAIQREANNYIDMDANNRPVWVVKNGSYVVYDRTADKFYFVVNNFTAASIDGGGNLTIAGTLRQNTTP